MVALRRSLWALLAGVSRATVDFTNEMRAPASSQFVSWRTKFVDHVFSPFRIIKKRLNRHRNFNGYYAVGGRDKPGRCALGRRGPGSNVRVLDPPLSTAFEQIWQQQSTLSLSYYHSTPSKNNPAFRRASEAWRQWRPSFARRAKPL